MLALWLVIAAWGVPGDSVRGPHHPRGHYHHQPHSHTKLTQDTELLRDVEHIKEDLGDYGMSKEAVHKLTPEELDFHYFKLHDFDNNTKLDGLEILQAIHHTVHKDEEHNREAEGSGGHSHEEKIPAEDDLPYFVGCLIPSLPCPCSTTARTSSHNLVEEGNKGTTAAWQLIYLQTLEFILQKMLSKIALRTAKDYEIKLEELIDQVLAEDDKDNDGYLSYMEYVIGRQKEQTNQDSVKRNLNSDG